MKKTIIMFALFAFFLLCNQSILGFNGTYIDNFTVTNGLNATGMDSSNNSYIWIVDNNDDKVYKYNTAGAYQGSWDTSVQSVNPTGVATDGSYFWVVDITDDEVYKYNMAGVYQGSWDTSVQSGDPNGIATDGTHVWIVDIGDDEVYKYTTAGVYVSSFDISTESNDPKDISLYANYLLVVDSVDNTVYSYTRTGTYIDSFSIAVESDDSAGITVDSNGSYIRVVDYIDDKVYNYTGCNCTACFPLTNPTWNIFSDKYTFTWNEGCTAEKYVMVRKDVGAYPANHTDGSLVANVTSATEIITDYSQNEETYYSMWEFSPYCGFFSTQHNFSFSDILYENVTEEKHYHENITFEGYINGTGIAFVNYTDTLTYTEDTNITVYEINGSNANVTTFYYNATTGKNDFQFNFTVNVSNSYEVLLRLNHTLFGYITDYFLLTPSDRNITSTSKVEDIFDIFGDTPFGWSSVIGFFVLLIGLFSFSSRNVGVALILTGGIMAFLSVIVGATVLDGTITALMIVSGIIVQWTTGGR